MPSLNSNQAILDTVPNVLYALTLGDEYKATPLHFACDNPEPGNVRCMLKFACAAGANVNIVGLVGFVVSG